MSIRRLPLLILSFTLGATALWGFGFGTAATDGTEAETAGNIKWMSFEEAVQQLKKDKAAGKAGKKIFIDIYTDWCGWCKRMDKETFQKPHIASYLTKHFYPVKLDAEQKEIIEFAGRTFKFVPNGRRGYHEFAAALLEGKMQYPTVVFLNEEVQLMQRIPGYLDVPTFDAILHYLAEENYNDTPWGDYQQAFQAKHYPDKK